MARNLFTHGMPEGLSEFEQKLYEEWVATHMHNYYNHKTTAAIVKLKNGFEVVGTSGCEDPRMFREDLGELYALKDALKKVGEFAAFHRAQKAFEGAHPMTLKLHIDKVTPELVECLRNTRI